MAEIPVFPVIVPALFRVRDRIVAAAVFTEGTGRDAGRKMLPGRRGMGNNRGAITGHGKGIRIDQSEVARRKDSQKEKDFLEGSLRIFSSRGNVPDEINGKVGRKSGGIFFCKFPVNIDSICRLVIVFTVRKQKSPRVAFPEVEPETVHKIIVRAKWREIISIRKNVEAGKENGIGEYIPDPGGKVRFGRSLIEKQD